MNAIHRTAAAVAALSFFAAGVQAQDEGLSRAQVQAELAAARADGTLAALHGEDSGSFHFSQMDAAAAASGAAGTAPGALTAEEAAALLGEDSGSFMLARREAAVALAAQRDIELSRVAEHAYDE